MADFNPMHAVDVLSNATDAALAALETRLARVETMVRDTALQSARALGGLLRDLETAPAPKEPPASEDEGEGEGNGGAGNPAPVSQRGTTPAGDGSKPLGSSPGQAVDPAAAAKGKGAVEKPLAGERQPRHRMV